MKISESQLKKSGDGAKKIVAWEGQKNLLQENRKENCKENSKKNLAEYSQPAGSVRAMFSVQPDIPF